MSVAFDPSTDFEEIVDGLEAVTLVRRDKAPTSIAHALQRRIDAREAEQSNGLYTTRDVRWHLPNAETGDRPDLGDVIRDAAGARYTILDTAYSTLQARWRCIARNLEVFWRLTDSVTIEKATFAKGTGGAAEATWDRWKTIRAAIKLISRTPDVEEEALRTILRWNIWIAEDRDITHEHRIIRADDTKYEIVNVTGPETIGELMRIEVMEWRRG